MKTFVVSATAIGLALAAPGLVPAAGPGGPGGPHTNGSMHGSMPGYGHGNYSYHGGNSYSHGNWYSREHFYWNYQCYSHKYGCNVYWCPTEYCYYYWCQSAACYYPVSYITFAPPTVTTQVVTTATQYQTIATPNVAVAQATGPSPVGQRPAGIPPAP
jgi:hypothetical protein